MFYLIVVLSLVIPKLSRVGSYGLSNNNPVGQSRVIAAPSSHIPIGR